MKKSFYALFLVFLLLLTGCGKKEAEPLMGYEKDVLSGLSGRELLSERLKPMAEGTCVITGEEFSDPVYVYSDHAGLFSESDARVLYAKSALTTTYPASLTKCMTALLVLENEPDLERIVEVTEVKDYGLDEPGSNAGLKVSDSYSVRDLLYGLLLPSGNDAANVLAANVAGSVPGFVEKMNARAHELGMTGTHFANPHGVYEKEHYTTVYDLYLLVRECLKHPEFSEISTTKEAEILCHHADGTTEVRTLETANSYVKQYTVLPNGLNLIGTKTGYTPTAGRCLIVAAKRDEEVYIGIITHAASYDMLFEEMNKLFALVDE